MSNVASSDRVNGVEVRYDLERILRIVQVGVRGGTNNDYGIKGRPTNISRVAILTGISRVESPGRDLRMLCFSGQVAKPSQFGLIFVSLGH